MIYILIKIQNISCTISRCRKLIIRHTSKAEDSYGLKKIEEKKQAVFDRKSYDIENKNPYIVSTKRKPEIMLEIEKTYRICRRVYQFLFVDVAYTFIEYIQSLDLQSLTKIVRLKPPPPYSLLVANMPAHLWSPLSAMASSRLGTSLSQGEGEILGNFKQV